MSHLLKRCIDVVLDTMDLNAAVFNDGVRTARVSIPGLPDATRIEHLNPTQIEMKRNMSMTDANKIGLDRFQSGQPCIGIVGEILVQRVAGSPV